MEQWLLCQFSSWRESVKPTADQQITTFFARSLHSWHDLKLTMDDDDPSCYSVVKMTLLCIVYKFAIVPIFLFTSRGRQFLISMDSLDYERKVYEQSPAQTVKNIDETYVKTLKKHRGMFLPTSATFVLQKCCVVAQCFSAVVKCCCLRNS